MRPTSNEDNREILDCRLKRINGNRQTLANIKHPAVSNSIDDNNNNEEESKIELENESENQNCRRHPTEKRIEIQLNCQNVEEKINRRRSSRSLVSCGRTFRLSKLNSKQSNELCASQRRHFDWRCAVMNYDKLIIDRLKCFLFSPFYLMFHWSDACARAYVRWCQSEIRF